MNLERLLAENMVRFGTKNLSEGLMRTLLNEGSQAGQEISDADFKSYTFRQTAMTEYSQTIASFTQKYNNTKIFGDGYNVTGEDTLVKPALMAVIAAAMPAIIKSGFNYQSYNNMCFEIGVNSQNDSRVLTAVESAVSNVSYTSKTVDVFPYAKRPTEVYTWGKVSSGTGPLSVASDKQTSTPYSILGKYLNNFNIGNVATDDFNQYVLSDSTTLVENAVNLQTIISSPNKLIVYSEGTSTPTGAGKEIETGVAGASNPIPKQYDVSFDTGVSTIPANDTEVNRAVQDAIALFPDGNITNLTVVSSASPEFNFEKGGPRTLADYGQTPTTGVGDPGAGTTDIAKNIKLAYDRGVSFMSALNAGLAAAGRPQVTNYTVNWQISDKGGQKVPGRYAEVQWEKAGSKGTPTAKTTGTGGTGQEITSGKDKFQYVEHTFSWTAAAAGKKKKG